MKMYLKKLLLTVLFLASFTVVYAVLAVLLVQFLFWFKPSETTIIYISLILTTGVMLYIVFLKRWENKQIKATYLEAKSDQEFSIKKDFIETAKSREIVIDCWNHFGSYAWCSHIYIAKYSRMVLSS